MKITRNNAFVPIPRAEDYDELQNHVSASLLKYNKKGAMPAQCRAFLELCPAADANRQLVDIMLLVRDIDESRVLAALDDAISTGKPTAELVRYYLYGQQMPDDAFAIEHSDLADYDRLIDGEGADDDGEE